MRFPAAHVGDMQTCLLVDGTVPHAGGPIIEGSATVLVAKCPAARVGDHAACGSSQAALSTGSATVMINGKAAVRVNDMTEHAGVVVNGEPSVLIG